MAMQALHWPGEAIWEAVAPSYPGFSVEILPSIDSTNTELMRRARAGRLETVLLVAEHQTAGRGRLGRMWESAVGDSLTFSLGLPLAPADWSGLSLAVGLTVAEQLQPQPPSKGDEANSSAEAVPAIQLKWPNDLWLQGGGPVRKLGGILIETANIQPEAAQRWGVESQARYVVVGIGINIAARQTPALSLPAGCVRELAPQWDAPSVLQALAPALVTAMQDFEREGFAPLQARFVQRDALLGQAVQLSDGTQGMACGVSADGALWIEGPQGRQAVRSNEVSVRPQGMPPAAPRAA